MVSAELLASVDALSDAERAELLAYIEGSLSSTPSDEQQAVAERRLAEMKADPSIGLSIEESIAAARAFLDERRASA